MSDLFTPYHIYPHGGKIKEHFKKHYDAAFVAFLPFFQIDTYQQGTNLKRSHIINFEQAKQELEIFKDLPELNALICAHSNTDYPDDDIIYKEAKVIPWSDIISGSGLKYLSELNKALETSIGKIRPIFQRHDLAEKLDNFTTEQHIWHPTEGSYDVISKIAIYKAFKLLKKKEIIAVDETWETTLILDIDKLSQKEFCDSIKPDILSIYSVNKELLFTMHWDNFFFLITASNENIEKILDANLFEGFLCDTKTTENWDYEDGEINAYLKIEKEL